MPQNEYSILDFLADGVVIVDCGYTVVFANQALAALYGVAPGELIGKKCYEISHHRILPCDDACLKGSLCSHAEVFRSGRSLTNTHRHILPDGTERLFEITTSPVVDGQGVVVRIVQLIKDVTELERLRQEVAASHRELRQIIDNVPFLLSFLDTEMRVVRLNPAMEAVMGVRAGEVRGKHCYDCWGQYSRDETRHGRGRICEGCKVPAALADGEKHSYERVIGDRVIEVVTCPVRDRNGAIVGAMEIGHDVTQRHEARLALEESEQRFRAILDSTPDAIFVTDRDARIADVSRRAILSLGYSREELLRMRIGDIDPDFSMQRHQRNIWGTLAPGERTTIERRYRRKDGSIFPVEIHISRMELDGQPVILNLVRDISERKRAEEALRESENSYRTLFESSPIALGIADFSGMRQYLAGLPPECAADYEGFFRNNPQELAACLSRLRISQVNEAGLKLFGADSQEEFIEGLFTIIGPETVPQTAAGISAIGRGELFFEQEIVLRHLRIKTRLHGILRWCVVPGYEETYQRVILSVTDISARKDAEEKLAEHRAQLQKLSVQLLETEDTERRRIARELHDKIGQQLTALGLNLNILEHDLPLGGNLIQRTRIADMLGLVEEMTEEVRDIMADLRPPVLDDYGLGAALHWYAGVFRKRSGIPCLVEGADIPRLPAQIEMTLFRVVQEALTNVAKHSQASRVEVRSMVTATRLSLTVEDNGIGFPAVAGKTGALRLGLVSMGERVASIGGTLTVKSASGSGTTIAVEVGI